MKKGKEVERETQLYMYECISQVFQKYRRSQKMKDEYEKFLRLPRKHNEFLGANIIINGLYA